MEIQALTANQLGLNTSVWTIMFFSAYKRSDVINLTCELYTASVIVANNTYNNVFTIPSGLRPKINNVANVIATNGSYGNTVACCGMISTDGKFSITIPKSDNKYIFINAEWRI
ncbi:MAG: hypothetical protein K1W34_08650 [Lachnospiraceae bacterium]